MRTINYLSMIIISVFFASCTKQGPAGPAGPAGAANLTSTSFTVTTTEWTQSLSNAESWHFYANIAPTTSDLVAVYFSHDDAHFCGVPFSNVFATGDQLWFNIDNSNGLELGYDNPSTLGPAGTLYYNIVVIPPTLQQKYPNTNWQNSSEVANIPEVKAALNNSGTK